MSPLAAGAVSPPEPARASTPVRPPGPSRQRGAWGAGRRALRRSRGREAGAGMQELRDKACRGWWGSVSPATLKTLLVVTFTSLCHLSWLCLPQRFATAFCNLRKVQQ